MMALIKFDLLVKNKKSKLPSDNVCLNIGKSNEDYNFLFTWGEVIHIFKNNESITTLFTCSSFKDHLSYSFIFLVLGHPCEII